MCGLAVDPAMIVAGRLSQGAFGAPLMPQDMSMIMMATFVPGAAAACIPRLRAGKQLVMVMVCPDCHNDRHANLAAVTG